MSAESDVLKQGITKGGAMNMEYGGEANMSKDNKKPSSIRVKFVAFNLITVVLILVSSGAFVSSGGFDTAMGTVAFLFLMSPTLYLLKAFDYFSAGYGKRMRLSSYDFIDMMCVIYLLVYMFVIFLMCLFTVIFNASLSSVEHVLPLAGVFLCIQYLIAFIFDIPLISDVKKRPCGDDGPCVVREDGDKNR